MRCWFMLGDFRPKLLHFPPGNRWRRRPGFPKRYRVSRRGRRRRPGRPRPGPRITPLLRGRVHRLRRLRRGRRGAQRVPAVVPGRAVLGGRRTGRAGRGRRPAGRGGVERRGVPVRGRGRDAGGRGRVHHTYRRQGLEWGRVRRLRRRGRGAIGGRTHGSVLIAVFYCGVLGMLRRRNIPRGKASLTRYAEAPLLRVGHGLVRGGLSGLADTSRPMRGTDCPTQHPSTVRQVTPPAGGAPLSPRGPNIGLP
mmetsp:Transcript_19151/g.48579  ORF Transcript_19151/g.48579 Transcript_19151/m.48579 type:complete len:251 (+) Transcript_19151:944-1696(+)